VHGAPGVVGEGEVGGDLSVSFCSMPTFCRCGGRALAGGDMMPVVMAWEKAKVEARISRIRVVRQIPTSRAKGAREMGHPAPLGMTQRFVHSTCISIFEL